jgi:hypothetical protein
MPALDAPEHDGTIGSKRARGAATTSPVTALQRLLAGIGRDEVADATFL